MNGMGYFYMEVVMGKPIRFSVPYTSQGIWDIWRECRGNAAWFRHKFSYRLPFGIVAYAMMPEGSRLVVQHATRNGHERSLYGVERTEEEYVAIILLRKNNSQWRKLDYFLL